MTSPAVNKSPLVRVGVGVLARHPVTRDVLIGKRTVKHGHGSYSFPGGHLEYGEGFIECAARELMEETNLSFQKGSKDVSQIATLNNVFPESGKHYVTILVEGTIEDAEALQNMEPEKCESWEWMSEDAIQAMIHAGREVFLPVITYYQQKSMS